MIVHEWTDPELVARIGRSRRNGGTFTLLFHDTHHRAVSAAGDIGGLDLADYDGVLAFGETLRQRYLRAGWGRQVFTWHEAADDRLFRPHPEIETRGDLVWVGNWGDDERSAEIVEFLVQPAAELAPSRRWFAAFATPNMRSRRFVSAWHRVRRLGGQRSMFRRCSRPTALRCTFRGGPIASSCRAFQPSGCLKP